MKDPKEKAAELVDKMFSVDLLDGVDELGMQYKYAIRCAIVAVNEILKANPCEKGTDRDGNFRWNGNTLYWNLVKNELLKLQKS